MVWRQAFRSELRRRGAAGRLGLDDNVVAVGPWWDTSSQYEIDALVLVGRSAAPAMVGEAKWALSQDASVLVADMRRKVERGLRLDPDRLSYAVCARTSLTDLDPGVLALTAADLFSDDELPA